MSHIPSAAMPHAKKHDDVPEPVQVPEVRESTPAVPWAGIALGGALVIGGVIAAALLTGRGKSGAAKAAGRRRKATRKGAAKKD